MRNQYKLLAEKYQLIQENDKEDVMAGLEFMGDINNQPIYVVEQIFCRHTYQKIGPKVITLEKIYEDFYKDEDMVEHLKMFTDDFPEFNDFVARINTFDTITLTAEESVWTFSRDLETLNQRVAGIEDENGGAF